MAAKPKAKPQLPPGMIAPGVLRCACDPRGTLRRSDLADLHPLQRDLKTLTDQRYEQLRESMSRYGYTAPTIVWVAPDGSQRIIDGHQRQRVLERENWTVDGGIPVVEIEAASEQDAAEKLLVIASQYGHVEPQSLYEFGAHFALDLQTFDLAALPEVDWDVFKAEFFEEGAGIPEDNKKLDEDAMGQTSNECPKCGFKW